MASSLSAAQARHLYPLACSPTCAQVGMDEYISFPKQVMGSATHRSGYLRKDFAIWSIRECFLNP